MLQGVGQAFLQALKHNKAASWLEKQGLHSEQRQQTTSGGRNKEETHKGPQA